MRRSQWTWLPSPGGRPWTSTSTTPPRVSPSFLAASTSATSRALASGSSTRTGLASIAARSEGCGTTSVAASWPPMLTTCESTSTPYAWRSRPFATAPSATRAAVSRALARSRTGRASSNPYFCMPTRSA